MGNDHDVPLATAAQRLTAVSKSSRWSWCPSQASSPDLWRSRVLPCTQGAPPARRVGRWGCPCPHALPLASARVRADAPRLATTTPPYVYQVCPRALSVNSPAGESSTPLRSVTAGTPGTTASPRAGPPRDRGSSLPAVVRAPAPSRGTPPHVPGSR